MSTVRSRGPIRALAGLFAVVVVAAACSTGGGGNKDGDYHIGISNKLKGNGWREEMICSMKAEAKASGKVSKMTIINENGDAAAQVNDLKTLIAAGVDAIVLNPNDRVALNDVIKEATSKGIVVVAVDQAVDEPTAYVLTNNQVDYGYLGAKWLFEKMGNKGNVVYMRGIDGVPADSDRDKGFDKALAETNGGITVSSETFTGWELPKGAEQIQAVFNSGKPYDGVWTSGIDSTVVDQFITAKKPFVPIVGADNNKFVGQLDTQKANGLVGAAVTNPPPVGGAGVALALKVLAGEKPARENILTPAVWDNTTDAGLKTLKEAYDKDLNDYYGVNYTIPDWTHYTKADLLACKGPGEA